MAEKKERKKIVQREKTASKYMKQNQIEDGRNGRKRQV